MPSQTFQSINTNNGGAKSRARLLSTKLNVEIRITTLLGVNHWLTRTRLSSYFQRLDALRWTPYLEECITALGEKEDQPTDKLLIHLVKLQLIVEKAGHAPWHEQRDDPHGSARVPPVFYAKALQARLQDFKANIPVDIQKNGMLSFIRRLLSMLTSDLLRGLAVVCLQHGIQSTRDSPVESIN